MVKQGIIEHVKRGKGFVDELEWYRYVDTEATRGEDIKVSDQWR